MELRRALAIAAALSMGVMGFGTGPTSATAPASGSVESCPVTLPRKLPPAPREAGFASPSFNYGNNYLRVRLWPRGVLIAGVLPDGGVMAEINRDGSIDAKQAWWRGLPSKLVGRELVITGHRLDAVAPPMRAYVPSGYGSLGVQPTGPRFPTIGCWRVVGRQGQATLAFVVKVVKVRPA
jgi:hypothetical protein